MNTGSRPALIFIRGLPGSGKSYLADALIESFGKQNTTLLDPDRVDLKSKEYRAFSQSLSEEGLDKNIHPFRWLRARAYAGITAHNIIVWNQPFTILDIFKRLVTHLQDYAQDQGLNLPVLLVEVEIDAEIAKARINKRKQAGGHGPSESTLNKRVNDYKSYANEGFTTVRVPGDGDVSASVAKVTRALHKLQQV